MRVRRGFALVAALFSIVLMAVLVTGVLFSAGQEARTTRNQILDQQAFAYAELAASRAIANWNGPVGDSLNIGVTASYMPAPDPPLASTVFVTKLDSALFMIVAEGRVSAGGAPGLRRRVGVFVRSVPDSVNPPPGRVVRVNDHAWAALY